MAVQLVGEECKTKVCLFMGIKASLSCTLSHSGEQAGPQKSRLMDRLMDRLTLTPLNSTLLSRNWVRLSLWGQEDMNYK